MTPSRALRAQKGSDAFRGAHDDVAARALACCEAFGFMRFARICGDRPFLPWELIEELIEMAEQQDLDLASNVVEKTYPTGTTTEIVATRALRRVLERTSDAEDREHLTRYIYANPGLPHRRSLLGAARLAAAQSRP